MKLATYTSNGQTRTGIVVGDAIIDSGVAGTMIDLIRDWDHLKGDLETKAAAGGGGQHTGACKAQAGRRRWWSHLAIEIGYQLGLNWAHAAAPNVH